MTDTEWLDWLEKIFDDERLADQYPFWRVDLESEWKIDKSLEGEKTLREAIDAAMAQGRC